MKRNNLIGKHYGKLKVVSLNSVSRNGHTKWNVVCNCGNTKIVFGTHLIQGNTVSCGECYSPGSQNFKGYKDVPLTFFSSVKYNSNRVKKRLPIEFDISIEDIQNLYDKQNKLCALSGLPISFKTKTASLDRIDSGLGYTKDNIQLLHRDINMMKRTYDQNYFVDLCRRVARKLK